MEEESKGDRDKTKRGLRSYISRMFKPSSSSIDEFKLLKREYPKIFKLSFYVPTIFLIFLILSTSIYSGIHYQAYIPDRNTMNVSTQEAREALSAYEIFENAQLADYIYKPIDWRLGSANPVGKLEGGDYWAEINMTQRHETLLITYEGSFYDSVSDERDELESVINDSGLNITLKEGGDRYTYTDEDLLATAGMTEDTVEDNFNINLYYRKLNHTGAQNIISSYEEYIDEERVHLKELETPPIENLHSKLTSAEIVHYWELEAGVVRGETLTYLKDVLNQQPPHDDSQCERWLGSQKSSKLSSAKPDEYLELVQDFVEERLAGSGLTCKEYTSTFIDAFYYSKNKTDNPYLNGFAVFPVKSSKIAPGVIDTGHRYIGVISLRDDGIQISFIDSQWGAEDFPSWKHIFMPTERSRFDALDQYHHLSFYRTGWLNYQMEKNRREILIGAFSLIALFSFFLFFIIRIERSMKEDKT